MNESKNDIRTSDNGDNIVMHDRGEEDNILKVTTVPSNDSDSHDDSPEARDLSGC